MIEALYEASDPQLPMHVPLPLFRPLAPVLTCTVLDTGDIYPRSRSLSR